MLKKLLATMTLMIMLCGSAQGAVFYVGAKFGWMDADISALDPAINLGGLFGVEAQNGDLRYGGELEITATVSDGDVGSFGEWDINTYSLYMVLKYGAAAYIKGKLGIAIEDVSVSAFGINVDGTDENLSGGIGAGYRFNDYVAVEAEATAIEEDVFFYSLGINFSFH